MSSGHLDLLGMIHDYQCSRNLNSSAAREIDEDSCLSPFLKYSILFFKKWDGILKFIIISALASSG